MGEAGSLALYGDELGMGAVRALLAAGPNHLGAAQPLPVATSDTLPPLLHTQVCACVVCVLLQGSVVADTLLHVKACTAKCVCLTG